jgi:hypothetical protein
MALSKKEKSVQSTASYHFTVRSGVSIAHGDRPAIDSGGSCSGESISILSILGSMEAVKN